LTISEIIELEKPAIIIPYSSKKVGQANNAEILQEKGAGVVFNNFETDKAIEFALELIQDRERLISMRARIKDLKGDNAARKIAENIDIWRKG